MIVYLLMTSAVIFACVVFNKISNKLGIPVLLAFIILGMLFGIEGIVKIPFDNYGFAEQICSIAMIFIMFYGGFGTKWSEARPIAFQALLLSSLGTILTAGLVGIFCHFILHIQLLESFLIGAVISSTDAASVFSILRSKRLNLKYNTASLLEIESGSNDPFSYMLTIVILSCMSDGTASIRNFGVMICTQIVFGVIFGIGIAVVALLILKRFHAMPAGFDAIFLVGVAIASYAVPSYLDGNGYLSAYITGIIIGNWQIHNKHALVNFFDGTTGLMQMLLFFLLGLLSTPSNMKGVIFVALCTALFLTFAARPAAVFLLLTPFKCKWNQQLFVAWSGMRGAASIVFAIMAVIHPTQNDNDIFHIVFFIVLFSILLQGSLIPLVAGKLNMTDSESDVMKTFTDYTEEVPVQFIQCSISKTHPWSGKTISEILLPPDLLLVLLIRGKDKIVPNGKTVLQSYDTLILSGLKTETIEGVRLYEREIKQKDEWAERKISDIPSGKNLIIMIKRGERTIIPKGNTVIRRGDVLVINEAGEE